MGEDLFDKIFQEVLDKYQQDQGVFVGSKWFMKEIDMLTAATIVMMEQKEPDGPSWEKVQEITDKISDTLQDYDLGSSFMVLRTYFSVIADNLQQYLEEQGVSTPFLEMWFKNLLSRSENH
jgi:hypothetical protein